MGNCNCREEFQEKNIYFDFLNSLRINYLKSEDLINFISDNYCNEVIEDKKKINLLEKIFPLIESSDIKYKEISQNLFIEYFSKCKNNFFSICFLCDKNNSDFVKAFETVCSFENEKYFLSFSEDKKFIKRKSLKEISLEYLILSTNDIIPVVKNLSEFNNTEKYLNDLFNEETQTSIITDLFQPFDNDDMINLDLFFKSDSFKRLTNKEEIYDLFELYYHLNTDK